MELIKVAFIFVIFGVVSVLGQYDAGGAYQVKTFRNCQEARLCCNEVDNKCYVPNARKMDGSIGKCYCDTKCIQMNDCCTDFASFCEAKDCQMGEWSTWTECSNPCGKGSKQRKRAIVQERAFGGKRCPGPRRQKQACHGEYGCLQQSVEYSREEMLEVGYIMPANFSIFRISKDYSPQHDIRKNLFFKNFQDNIIPRKPVYRAIYRVTHARGSCEDHPWAKVLKHGAEVCVECQPTSMNKRLERCRGHGVFRQETMWNAIEVKNCHGKWKMITHHESETCNHQGDHDFVLV